MKYLTKVVETYRIGSEKEVEAFLKELKADHRFTVAKYRKKKKEKKAKGEVVYEWIRFEVTKLFNEEAEPTHDVDIDYEIRDAWMGPDAEEDEE